MSNKQLNREPSQESKMARITNIVIAIILIIFYLTFSFLYPNILPNGVLDIILGITLISIWLFRAYKGEKIYFIMMILSVFILLTGIDETFDFQIKLKPIYALIVVSIFIIKLFHNAISGKYDP